MVTAALLAGLVFWPHDAGAEIEGDQFSSPEWRVSIKAPRDWQLTDRTSYPNILVVMSRTDPNAKILLSAQKVAPGTTTRDYAQQTAVLLHEMGFQLGSPRRHPATGAQTFDMQTDTAFLRQAAWVYEGIGYALTLTTPSPVIRNQQLRAFDQVLRSVTVLPPALRSETAPAGTPAKTAPAGTPAKTAPARSQGSGPSA